MEQAKLNKILDNHKLWLKTNGEQGEKADLSYADLRSADLRYANLRSANLRSADLRSADLSSADLSYADLSSADLDYSAFPLWCGGLDVHIDDKQATQLLYHLIRNVTYSKNTSKAMKKICRIKSLVKQANQFHKVDGCGKIESVGEDE